MNMIYQFSENLYKKDKCKKKNIFLFINIIIWSLFAFMITAIGCYIFFGNVKEQGELLFGMVGWIGIMIGFFGGIIYLYNKEDVK